MDPKKVTGVHINTSSEPLTYCFNLQKTHINTADFVT